MARGPVGTLLLGVGVQLVVFLGGLSASLFGGMVLASWTRDARSLLFVTILSTTGLLLAASWSQALRERIEAGEV